MFEFNIQVNDKYSVVEFPKDEIDFTKAKVLQKRLKDLVKQGHLNIILNLANVTYIDSTFLGVIIGIHKLCVSSGGELRICCLNRDVEMIFYLTGVDSFLNIFFTINEAINYKTNRVYRNNVG